jgi:ABC-type multidrug transport system fused ATPase/permease subunit
MRVAREAGLGDLLAHGGGLDGAMGEGGRALSARARSALSLARLLLGRPKLVLLGEALWHLAPHAQDALAAHLDACGTTVLRHPVLAGTTNGAFLAA